jgi:hypothetical protein
MHAQSTLFYFLIKHPVKCTYICSVYILYSSYYILFVIYASIFGDQYFWTITIKKQRRPRLLASNEFEFLQNIYRTTVAMATMTPQYGGYFEFKVNDIGDPKFVFHKMVSLYSNGSTFYNFCE